MTYFLWFSLYSQIRSSGFTIPADFEHSVRGIICNMIDFYLPYQEALITKMETSVHEAAHGAISNLLIENLDQNEAGQPRIRHDRLEDVQ